MSLWLVRIFDRHPLLSTLWIDENWYMCRCTDVQGESCVVPRTGALVRRPVAFSILPSAIPIFFVVYVLTAF